MNRNLKKIITLILAIGAFSAFTPTTNLNLMTTKAYADETDGITSLKIKNSGGNSISIYDDSEHDGDDKVDNDKLESGKTYYAKTSSDDVEISVNGVDSDCVRVFNGSSSDSKRGERTGSSISLSDSTTTIIVRVYSSNPGVVKYGDDSYISQYRIKVKYTGSDDDDEMGNVYLKSITLSNGTINFSKRTYTYDINVPEDIDEITIGARPNCDADEYDNYKVKIDGTKVDDNDDEKYKKDVSLSKGKNTIEITVEDDEDNENSYTLNINRGEVANTNSNNGATDVKTSGWIENYYVKADGNRATGWLNYDGVWYYLGSDGTKKTEWQSVNGAWYYLYPQTGIMAYNTTIGGYELGSDGAWIK